MSINRAQVSVKFSIERLRAQTNDLSEQQYPGDHPGPRKWLRLVTGLLDTAEVFLIWSQHSTSEREKTASLLRDAADLAAMAYQCLGVMRGSAIDELPYPLVPPLQRWFDQLQISNTTFFRAELVANYELRRFFQDDFRRIKNPSRILSDVIEKEISWPVLRVTVPSKAFAILPHFAIVAHEIGHALFHKVNWNTAGFAQEEASLSQRICARLGLRDLDAEAASALQRSFSNWFEELAADAFALYLTGPAIFFSLSDFFQLLGSGYGLSITHPANDLRRRVLFNEIQKGDDNSFAKIFQRHTGQEITEDFNSPLLVETPTAKQIFQDMRNKYKKEKVAAVLTELHESISNVVGIIYHDVHEFLQLHASAAIYTPNAYEQDLKNHLLPMLAAIPPIETGASLAARKPAEFATILNVGWATLLTKLPELRVRTDDETNAGKLEALHGLLLKAVELSEARRLWGSV